MITNPPTAEERDAFYVAAVLGLRALDTRESTPRRFGPDADARWAQFAGALGVGDRIDILLRDAAGTLGAAFAPAECFDFFGLADDEPFGPNWQGIADHAAKRFFADGNGKQVSIDALAQTLGVGLDSVAAPPLTPATKLVVAGGSALVTVAKAFEADTSLSWTDQVVTVASKASFRQLASLVAVFLGARGRTLLIRPSADAAATLRAAGFAHIDVAVVSSDAELEASEFARSIGGK